MRTIMKKLIHTAFLAFIAGILLLPMCPAKAANPSKATIKENRTYQKYDITGDRKADMIKIMSEYDNTYGEYLKKVTVQINGRNCFSLSGMKYGDTGAMAKIYTLKNGKPFLYLYTMGDNDDGTVCGIFQYRSGKLKQIINCNTFLGTGYGMHFGGRVAKVKGNTMTVEFRIMSWTTGVTTVRIPFSYRKGTLRQSSAQSSYIKIATYPKTSKLTVRKGMKVYSKPAAKKARFSLRPGQKVRIKGVYVKKGSFCVKIKAGSNGKTGWIKCFKTISKDGWPPFQEAFYAG